MCLWTTVQARQQCSVWRAHQRNFIYIFKLSDYIQDNPRAPAILAYPQELPENHTESSMTIGMLPILS